MLAALQGADAATKRMVRKELRQAAEGVRAEAQLRFSAIDTRTAAGYRVAVRQKGIAVVQSLRKTTGRRPDYGTLQMRRALLPARDSAAANLQHEIEAAFDRIANNLNGGGSIV